MTNTVRENWHIACPKCNRDDELKVAIRTWGFLLPEGTEEDGDHEWDSESDMMCGCGWEGKAGDAHIEEAPPTVTPEPTPETPVADETAKATEPAPGPERYYVTVTWDDWPEGGSYGDVVMATGYADAENQVKMAMANSRSEERGTDDEDDEDDTPEAILRDYGDEWHVVDCYPLRSLLDSHIPNVELIEKLIGIGVDELASYVTIGDPPLTPEEVERRWMDASIALAAFRLATGINADQVTL